MSDILIRSACGGNSTIVLMFGAEASHWAILRILVANKRWLDPSSPSNKTPFLRAVQSANWNPSFHYEKVELNSFAGRNRETHVHRFPHHEPLSFPPAPSVSPSWLPLCLWVHSGSSCLTILKEQPCIFFPPPFRGIVGNALNLLTSDCWIVGPLSGGRRNTLARSYHFPETLPTPQLRGSLYRCCARSLAWN